MFDGFTGQRYCPEPLNRSKTQPKFSNSVSDFREWVGFTNTNSNRIQQLKCKFPDYLTKIKKGLYLEPQEKELQYLIHRRDKHSGNIHKGYCFLMCGDFRMYQKLSKRLYFGKYQKKTWQQVEAIDPGYIDSLCEKLYKGSQDRQMVDYIRRERKAYQQNQSKQRQNAHSQEKERGVDLSERRSRSRQKK